MSTMAKSPQHGGAVAFVPQTEGKWEAMSPQNMLRNLATLFTFSVLLKSDIWAPARHSMHNKTLVLINSILVGLDGGTVTERFAVVY